MLMRLIIMCVMDLWDNVRDAHDDLWDNVRDAHNDQNPQDDDGNHDASDTHGDHDEWLLMIKLGMNLLICSVHPFPYCSSLFVRDLSGMFAQHRRPNIDR